MLTHKMNTWVLQVGEMFGNFSSIGQEQWKDLYVYAYEGQAEVISIDNSSLEKYYQTVIESKDRSEFSEFLTLTVPGFSGRLISSKEKISKCFYEKWFTAGAILASEG